MSIKYRPNIAQMLEIIYRSILFQLLVSEIMMDDFYLMLDLDTLLDETLYQSVNLQADKIVLACCFLLFDDVFEHAEFFIVILQMFLKV